MKRMISLLVSAALLLATLAACQESASPSELPERQPAALEVVNAMLPVSGYNRQSGELEYFTVEEDEAGFLTAYLENAYGLSEGAWRDAAVIRATGASAFELAVLRLENEDEAAQVAALLTSYRFSRQGDFVGYAPEQADMVANGGVAQSGSYTALCICPRPNQAAAAFTAAVNGDFQLDTPLSDSLPSDSPPSDSLPSGSLPSDSLPSDSLPSDSLPSNSLPSDSLPPETLQPGREDEGGPATLDPGASEDGPGYPGRYPFVQPNQDDMSLYDTSAILAAWENGDPSQLSEYDQDIYNAAKNVLDKVLMNGMSDLEKEIAVYSWIVNNVNYDWTHQNVMRETPRESFTPYGGLVNHTAVCLGYATTFQLLMDLAGVECITIAGAAYSSQEDHGWNMVRLNGNWYCVDVTWDANYREYGVNRGRERDWVYFNVTSNDMAASDHQWDYANTPEAVTMGKGRS